MAQDRHDRTQFNETKLIALRIRELCFRNNWTLSDLAAKADMPLSSLRDIINGKNADIRLSTLMKISMGLNMDLADFFDAEIFRESFLTRLGYYRYS